MEKKNMTHWRKKKLKELKIEEKKKIPIKINLNWQREIFKHEYTTRNDQKRKKKQTNTLLERTVIERLC